MLATNSRPYGCLASCLHGMKNRISQVLEYREKLIKTN